GERGDVHCSSYLILHDSYPIPATVPVVDPPVISALPHTSPFLYTDSSDSDTSKRHHHMIRMRSPSNSVSSVAPMPGALFPMRTDLLPPHKRVRGFVSMIDCEASLEESYEPYTNLDIDFDIHADIDACIAAADAIAARETGVRVGTKDKASEEAESSTRGMVEIGVDRVTHPVVPDDLVDPVKEDFPELSRKRCRSPSNSVSSVAPMPGALFPMRADLLPPRKRVRGFVSMIDCEASLEESYEPYTKLDIDFDIHADIDACIAAADAIAARETGVRVETKDKASEEAESSTRGMVEIGVDRVTHPVVSDDLVEPVKEDFPELDMVRALPLDKKNQSSAPASSPTPAPVKAVELNCVTCGGTHWYQNCPATNENVYRENIQEYVSQAAATNYNQGNTGFQPQMIANQIQPPGFPPHPNNQNNFNQGNNFNQNRGGNFNQSNFNQGGNFNQGQLHRPQSKFASSNTASSSGSGTLHSITINNPKEDLKGITARSSVAYQGPTIPTPSKVVKQGTEVTKDQVQTPSSQSTAPVQPLVVQSETQNLVSVPIVALVSALMPNLKPSILYLFRRDNERRRDQANEQIEKFYKIFKDMSFEISFTDALSLLPKFASTLKALIGNKEKLSGMARTPMNEHCSAVILNKLPRKLGDP
nr:reverse transcriptase domain-containing protein [Tanacetum cinerariifolium]